MTLRPLTEAEIADIRHKLYQLESEHRELDRNITHLDQVTNADPLLIRRQKKQKLALKDRILVLRHMLNPATGDSDRTWLYRFLPLHSATHSTCIACRYPVLPMAMPCNASTTISCWIVRARPSCQSAIEHWMRCFQVLSKHTPLPASGFVRTA